jgi:hypothetical protein
MHRMDKEHAKFWQEERKTARKTKVLMAGPY